MRRQPGEATWPRRASSARRSAPRCRSTRSATSTAADRGRGGRRVHAGRCPGRVGGALGGGSSPPSRPARIRIIELGDGAPSPASPASRSTQIAKGSTLTSKWRLPRIAAADILACRGGARPANSGGSTEAPPPHPPQGVVSRCRRGRCSSFTGCQALRRQARDRRRRSRRAARKRARADRSERRGQDHAAQPRHGRAVAGRGAGADRRQDVTGAPAWKLTKLRVGRVVPAGRALLVALAAGQRAPGQGGRRRLGVVPTGHAGEHHRRVQRLSRPLRARRAGAGCRPAICRTAKAHARPRDVAGRAPEAALLDEPTAGLSPRETKDAAALISRLARRGADLVFVADMEVVFGIADWITVCTRAKYSPAGLLTRSRRTPPFAARTRRSRDRERR